MSGGFHSAAEAAFTEREGRKDGRAGILSFGVDYLDDACEGIIKNDLILIGAHSGGGKTQFCCNIAMTNAAKGRRIHYLALEAESFEIERRMLYQLFSKYYFADKDRPQLDLSFQKWMLGDFLESGAKYEFQASEEFEQKYKSLFTFYKFGDFTVQTFIEKVVLCSDETDLIIVDHVHYFDFEDDNENRAVREIAKTARTLALEGGIPIILVAHIRKRDRFNTDLAPGQEEFHGSSDLYKIATKAITLAPGAYTSGGKLETFFRIVKNRHEGSVVRYIGSTTYLSGEGRYESGYKVGDANQKRENGFTSIEPTALPRWARSRHQTGGDQGHVAQAYTIVNHAPGRAQGFTAHQKYPSRNKL